MPEAVTLVLFAYLLGSISSAVLLSKILGFEDPRSQGSKNPGATNVLRIAGKRAAFFTLLGDCLKGLLPVIIARQLSDDHVLIAMVAFAAFIGHCFPLFFNFRGGKGVATAMAATLGFNWIIGAIIIAIWLLFAKVFRVSSLAAIFAFCALPPLILWFEQSLAVSAVFLAISLILIWRHRGNIQRLLQGTES